MVFRPRGWSESTEQTCKTRYTAVPAYEDYKRAHRLKKEEGKQGELGI
jgi:hypothetical protein